MSARYVVVGLARARSAWFRQVSQWATAAALPLEFVKCVSAEELRARLASGRTFSAALVDGTLSAVDRDLFDEARTSGVAVVVVDDGRGVRDWPALGAAAVLPTTFDQHALLGALSACARPVDRADAIPGEPLPPPEPRPRRRGSVAMVCGPGGTGTSTVAAALAQGLADDLRIGRSVLLADFALHADQAVLHDARDVVPGVQELVEAHRLGRPSADELRALTFAVPERGYRLLLGLRRARLWPALRPRAVAAAVDSLRVGFRAVVCDTDPEIEGEEECGSTDVEDRHVLARAAARGADVVFVVGLPGVKGVHAARRVMHDLQEFGVTPGRIVPVVNRAPRGRRARADIVAALDRAGAVFLPERRVDELFHDGVRFPSALTAPLAGACLAVRERLGAVDAPRAQPVRPGSVAVWSS
jgi:septum formation inhibitor-activating ATPase MinD